MSREEILQGLADSVVAFDEKAVRHWAEKALEADIDPYDGILNGLAVGMDRVGDLMETQEYFIPEVLMCVDAMEEGMKVFKPRMKGDEEHTSGTVVIGTVQGDIHDIGKNLVRMMLELNGFRVVDLGKDVKPEEFLVAVQEHQAEILCLSAMMTTSMLGMKKVIALLRETQPQVKVLIGGSPVTPEVAELFGADGFGKDAVQALRGVRSMLANLREL